MAALYDLREELTALLRQGLPDAAVTGEYPGEGRRYPQTVPAVAVGIAEAALLCPDLHRPVRSRGDRDPARHCHHRL